MVRLLSAISWAAALQYTLGFSYHKFPLRSLVRQRLPTAYGKGFGRPSPRSKNKDSGNNPCVNPSSPSPLNQNQDAVVKPGDVRAVAVSKAASAYRGPSPPSGSVAKVLAAVEIEAYGVILEVGESVVVPGELGLFLRLAPGVAESTLPSGLVLGGFGSGDLRNAPPPPEDPQSGRAVRFELKGDAADTTVLFNGQVVRILDLLRQKAPFYGLVAHAGVIPSSSLNAGDDDNAASAPAPQDSPEEENASSETTSLSSSSQSTEPASSQEIRSARHVLVAQAAVGAVSVAGHTLLRSARASDGQLMAATLIPGEAAAVVAPTTATVATASDASANVATEFDASAAEAPNSGAGKDSDGANKQVAPPPPPPVVFVPRPLPQQQQGQDGAESSEVAWIQEVGQFANDLVIGRSEEDGSLVCPTSENDYEDASRVRNVAVLQWRLEAVDEVDASKGTTSTSLRPTFPVLATGKTVTFDNEAAMEIGCRYGYAFWAKPQAE